MGSAAGSPLPFPFVTTPFDTDTRGNASANDSGMFRQDGGLPQWRYFLGTEGTPGSLIMDFAAPFTNGPGPDFAIVTSAESWGPRADVALFEFFLEDTFQAAFPAPLDPDKIFLFDLLGSRLVANRVIVTNLTPDPPGINELGTMTFDNAGVAHLLVDPSTFVLLSAGLSALVGLRLVAAAVRCTHVVRRLPSADGAGVGPEGR
jgi:hypothetical protein